MFRKLLLILILLFLNTNTFAKVTLSEAEKLFLEKNPRIILGTDKNWEPYTLINSKGKITGYDASVLELINEQTGANFVIKRGAWKDIKEEAKAGIIHGTTTGTKSEERAQYMNFSKPYLELGKIVFTNIRNKNKISRMEDLKGKIFAVDRHNIVSLEFARAIEGVKILELEDSNQSIKSVSTGEADAMLGNAAMFYILNKMGNPFLKPSIFPKGEPLSLVFAVNKKYPEAISIINKALDEIGDQKLMELKKFWFQINLDEDDNNSTSELTKDEKLYLKQKSIKMCIDPHWMPFEKIENGVHIGISADFFAHFNKLLNTNIKVVPTQTWTESLQFAKQRKCDILSMAMETPNRKEYMNFTSAYLDVPMVLATKNDVAFMDDLDLLEGKKIAVENSHAFIETLESKHPEINLIGVPSVKIGLQKVADGEIFGFIGSIADIGYVTRKNFIGELKISGKFDERLALSIGVRNDDKMLFEIFEKVVNVIPGNLKQEILNKHIAIKYEQKADYELLMRIIIFFFVIILFVVYWNRKLSIAKEKLELAQKAIKKKNEELKMLSITDKLTGVYNRTKIDNSIEKELSRTVRYNHSLSIILVDIDYFKAINDTHGHLVGDKVLVSFANILKENTRSTDIVGRWGGEEFLIVCPETDLDGATALARELKTKIETFDFEEAKKCTASFGLTANQSNDTLDTLILRADEALYKAKESGRNRVEFK